MAPNMHRVLQRQLERVYGANIPDSPEFQRLIEMVSSTYEARDDEYALIERSLDISSKELTELNEQLRGEKVAIEEIVDSRTKELTQERSKLEKVAQNMETEAILLDKNEQVVFVNDMASTLIGLHGASYVGALARLSETFSGYPISDYIARCLSGSDGELQDVESAGRFFKIKFQVLSTKSDYLIWIKDVTSEKLHERSKHELLAIASHQLRSPLTVVKGNTEMLNDELFGALTDEQREIVQQIMQSNENMISLIEQMLDITKLSQRSMQFDLTGVAVDRTLQHVITDLNLFAQKYGVTINSEINPDSGAIISADETRLYQVFQNLIENAIKYSDPESGDGIVHVTSLVSDGRVIIQVKDAGIGIPLSEQSNLFKQFYRASNATKFMPNGSGLGLYIVKSIIELIDGTISFTSAEGMGTKFTITFPIKN